MFDMKIEMIRKSFRFFSRRYWYILSVMLVTIMLLGYVQYLMDLHHRIELTKCKELLSNQFSNNAKKYIHINKEKRSGTLNATKLRRWIQRRNAQNRVLNMDLYGPLTTDTVIFVVQVHRYSCNLKYLIASLSEVEGIQDTLIIFSHSYVDENLNRRIQRIDFCRILQIFFPYSVQAYPNEFPGYDKNDCPTNLNMKAAIKLNCTNAISPDIYGRYRNPFDAEKKHFWWWTANKVFADIPYTKKHKGIVVFLETNFYIYKNFVYMANAMKNIANTLHQYHFLSLGSQKGTKGIYMYDLELTTWNPAYHSKILAIDFSTWKTIKSYYKIFCRTDDYSWSRSIFDISINHSGGKVFKVLSGSLAKALPICFSIEDVIDCDVAEEIVEVINLQKMNKELLFPRYLQVYHDIDLYDDGTTDFIEIGGGWNDPRDKHLCSKMTLNKVKRRLSTVESTRTYEYYSI